MIFPTLIKPIISHVWLFMVISCVNYHEIQYCTLFLWGNRTIYIINRTIHTCRCWKYEIISCVEQDISLIVRFAHSWDILVNTWNKFHIPAHPCIWFDLYCNNNNTVNNKSELSMSRLSQWGAVEGTITHTVDNKGKLSNCFSIN